MNRIWSFIINLSGILILLGTVYQLYQLNQLDFDAMMISYQPLPEIVVRLKTVLIVVLLAFGVVGGVGILLRKNVCRQLILFCSFVSLFTYLIEYPFLVLPNNHAMITFFYEKISETVMIPKAEFCSPVRIKCPNLMSENTSLLNFDITNRFNFRRPV